jgi:hypothetical protein
MRNAQQRDDLDEQVSEMVAWLHLVMPPAGPARVIPPPVDQTVYRHWDDDALELGDRVADELLTEWAWGRRDPVGLALVLERRIRQATARRTQPADESTPLASAAGVM